MKGCYIFFFNVFSTCYEQHLCVSFTMCDHCSIILGNPASSSVILPLLKSILNFHAFFLVLKNKANSRYVDIVDDQKALTFFAVLTNPCKKGDIYVYTC